jgi:hypothetical protein
VALFLKKERRAQNKCLSGLSSGLMIFWLAAQEDEHH